MASTDISQNLGTASAGYVKQQRQTLGLANAEGKTSGMARVKT